MIPLKTIKFVTSIKHLELVINVGMTIYMVTVSSPGTSICT